MRDAVIHVGLCMLAALTPLAIPESPGMDAGESTETEFPGWPQELDGRPLTALPVHPDDARFVEDLPGARVARFSDGRQTVLVRWSPNPTRNLHPSERCLRASGWDVRPAPGVVDRRGLVRTAYLAERDGVRVRVQEFVRDATGRTWADPTDHYWAGLLGRTSGPAFAFTITTPVD